MSRKEVEISDDKCRRSGCKGVIIEDINGEPVCLACGRTPAPIGPKPKPLSEKPKQVNTMVTTPPLFNANGTLATDTTTGQTQHPETFNQKTWTEAESTPVRKKKGGAFTYHRNKEIEAQAPAIILDYNAGMGIKHIKEKYKISGCAWYNFKKRHAGELINKNPDKNTSTFEKPRPAEDSKEKGNNPVFNSMITIAPFPTFPVFNSEMAELVQLAWLECYTEIIKVKMAECKFSGIECNRKSCDLCPIQHAYNCGRREEREEQKIINEKEWTSGADYREDCREVNE